MHQLQPVPDTAWLQKWSRLSRRLRQELTVRYAGAGLNESRAAVLEALSASQAAYTQTDLASELSLSESNLCALIERMRTEGLLIRERSTIDRRKTLLSVTPEGGDACACIAEIKAELGADLSTHISPTFATEMHSVLDGLLLALDAIQSLPLTQRRSA